MKASELRIGNWVFNKARERKELTAIYPDCSAYDPIPLTEEWLLKLGFEDWGVDVYGYKEYVLYNVIDGTSNFQIAVDGDNFYPTIDEDVCCWSKFKYVHQLQNLYFALTGEELTIS